MKLIDIFFARKTGLWKIFHQHRMLFSSTQGGISIKVAFGIQISIQSKVFLHLKAGAGQKDKNTWKPVWITIPEVARACSELIGCMGANRRMQCPLQVHKIRSFLYRLVRLYMCILATFSKIITFILDTSLIQ